MVISSIYSSALAAPNLKDLPRRPRFSACVLVGNLPKRGNSPSPCNGLFALEGLSFATDFLRDLAPGEYPAGLLDGLASPA
jgi:hypothetical protein